MGLSLREPSRRGGLESPEQIALYRDASVGAEERAVLGPDSPTAHRPR